MRFHFSLTAFLTVAMALNTDIRLKPARRHDALAKRQPELVLAERVELFYAQGEGTFESNFGIQADRPILHLEEFDHLLKDVRCNGPVMSITLLSGHVFEKAPPACAGLKGGLLISSHFSCSEGHEHSYYRVLDIAFDQNTSSISLILESGRFEDLFQPVTFHLGRSTKPPAVHQHDRLFRRQDVSASSGPVATSTAPPNALGTHVNEFPLDFTNTNSSFPFLDDLGIPIDFGCSNCSATGQLVLTTVDIELNDPFDEGDRADDDWVKSGRIEFALKGFELSIGLRAVPSVEFEDYIPFFDIPFRLGIMLGPVSAGIGFEIGAYFAAQASGGIELGFGFDVVVPDTALVFDIAELQNSEMPGLDKAEITPHTLQANASDIEVSLKAALRPSITLGLQLGIVEISAGPYMDLPSFNLTTTQLATDNVGANCETGGDTDIKFKDAFQNLTSVDFSVGVEAGFIANFEALLASYEPSISLVGAVCT